MRMYVVACPSPSLISSAAIVQGSPFISHLLASPLRRRRIFWAKSGCAPNGRPGTDAAVPPMHLKTENEIQCVRHSSGIGTKAIPSGEGGSLPTNWWGMGGRGQAIFFTLGRPEPFFTAGNQRPHKFLPLGGSCQDRFIIELTPNVIGWSLNPFSKGRPGLFFTGIRSGATTELHNAHGVHIISSTGWIMLSVCYFYRTQHLSEGGSGAAILLLPNRMFLRVTNLNWQFLLFVQGGFLSDPGDLVRSLCPNVPPSQTNWRL